MGNKTYSGGGTVLGDQAEFTTFDPAARQKPSVVRSEPVFTPLKPSTAYTVQVQQQHEILLRKIARGENKPYVPTHFRSEIGEFGSLLHWAKSRSEFERILSEVRHANSDRRDFQSNNRKSGTKRRRPKSSKKSQTNEQAEKVSQQSPKAAKTRNKRCKVEDAPVAKLASRPSHVAVEKPGISESELFRRISAVKSARKE